MPKVDMSSITPRTATGYPAPYDREVTGRTQYNLGDSGGLTQFGVKLVELAPGAWSSHRHWHEQEDEFVMVLSGALVMVEDEGETQLVPGDCATHKAGSGNGHHLQNRSTAPARFLVVGTRSAQERAHYPEIDLLALKDAAGMRFLHKDGTPY